MDKAERIQPSLVRSWRVLGQERRGEDQIARPMSLAMTSLDPSGKFDSQKDLLLCNKCMYCENNARKKKQTYF